MARMSDKKMDETQEFSSPEIEKPDSLEITQSSKTLKSETSDEADPSLEDTQKLPTVKQPAKSKDKGQNKWRYVLGILLALIIFIALGALGGMQSGIQTREDQELLSKAVEAVAQFELGKNDLASGNCEIARQRFEYVIQLNSSFPNAAQRLADSMLCVGIENVAVSEATQVPTATADGRSASDIFSEASSYFAASKWDNMLPLLDTLRNVDANYEAVEVDGMYYTALRNRGVNRILSLGELEGGIFDLNQAEKIGPLDAEAYNYRQWAILYIVGQSFWDVDWGQAVQYFGQIAAVAPNLHGGNFFTAQDRLREAQSEFAKELVTSAIFIAGAKGWCEAKQIMNEANSYAPHSPEVQVTAEWIIEKCELNPNEEADLN